MKKVLFVCLGNICRSPMAEFIFKDMVKQAGLEKDFYIESAATSDEEWGNDVYPMAKQKLYEEGIPFAKRRARQMTRADYDKFDLICAMDLSNLRNIDRITGGNPEGKVSLLLDWAGEHRSISDPWYTRDFDAAYNDIVRGCEALLEKIR